MKCMFGLILLYFCLLSGQARADLRSPFAVMYELNAQSRYIMTGQNQDDAQITDYSVVLSSITRQRSDGVPYDDFKFTDLIVNGERIALDQASLDLRQPMSVDLRFDFTKNRVNQVGLLHDLAAPSDDLFNIFVDLQVAARLTMLQKTGDHLYIPYGVNTVYLNGDAQTCVYFDVFVESVDRETGVAALRVKHVPPKKECVAVTAAWMHEPVQGNLPNNVAQVKSLADGGFNLTIGSETIEVLVKVKIGTADILSADLTDSFTLLDRHCDDRDGSHCGEPRSYRQVRKIRVRPL